MIKNREGVLSEYFDMDNDILHAFKGCKNLKKTNRLFNKTVNLSEMYIKMVKDIVDFVQSDEFLMCDKYNNKFQRNKKRIRPAINQYTIERYSISLEFVYNKLFNNGLKGEFTTDKIFEILINEVGDVNKIDWMKIYDNMNNFHTHNNDILLNLGNHILNDSIYEFFRDRYKINNFDKINLIKRSNGKYEKYLVCKYDGGIFQQHLSKLIRNKKHWWEMKTCKEEQNRQKIKEYDTLLNYNIKNDILPDYCPVFKNVRLNYTTVDWIGTGTFQRLKRLSKIAGNDKEETWSYASIDRIDSNFEYDYNNIRIISDYANSLKSCASDNQIVRLGEFLKNNKNSMEFECGLGI